MAKTLVAFLLAAVLALSVVSVLLYAQTMDLRTTNRDDVFAKFREFEIYKEFKEKYPDSVDEDRVENGLHTLDSSYAEDGDKISLNILSVLEIVDHNPDKKSNPTDQNSRLAHPSLHCVKKMGRQA